MPSNATITSFHTFVANTKARASQVNTNFDNLRGHLVPINTDTQSASDLTHDLGSDEHRWRTSYVRDIDLETSTTTATLVIKGDTSVATGQFLFQIEGVTKAAIGTSGITTASLPGTATHSLSSQSFTSNGTWTAPSDCYWVIVTGCGGGGGGGGGKSGEVYSGGGGGGSALNTIVVGVTPGNAYSITVGAGGSGGATDATGTSGGVSMFAGAGATVYFMGGLGGYGATNTGYAVSSGDRSPGSGLTCRGGAGGAGADAPHGEDMSGTYSNTGYSGGTSPNHVGGYPGGGGGGAGAFGNGAAGGASTNPGSSASANTGAGGGGGGGSGGAGGNGGSGRMIIHWLQHA